MKTADVDRFLGVWALVSGLYCPGYNPRQSLEKDSNLARTAIRYKIDVGRVAAAVRADLTKNKKRKGRRDQQQDCAENSVRTARTDNGEKDDGEQIRITCVGPAS